MIQILHPDGRVLQLDATTKIEVGRTVTVAQHPIERGAPSVDHVEPENDTLTITAKITETPTEGAQVDTNAVITEGLNGRRVEAQGVTSVTEGLTGIDRVQAAVDFLRACVGELVDVIASSGRFVWTNCLLTAYPNDLSIVRASTFTLQFMIPRLVNVSWATIPALPSVPASLQKETEKGATSTEDLSDEDKSAAARLQDYLNERLGVSKDADYDVDGKRVGGEESAPIIPHWTRYGP